MNPHFMFNALNSIQEQFMYGDKTVANEQMGNFTYLTRQILTVSGKKKINLSTEIEILTKYLELEKMRFAEGFNYKINLSENIDEDYHQIPPMLIQPFVENSIKHGLLHKQGDKKVSVSFDLDEKEENLICVVEDNGVGREKSAEIKSKRIQQHESFSTSATEERLRLLSNNLNNNDLVVYEDLKNEDQEVVGTKVTLTIAL
jgi:sensor histidine kinase YesM